MKNENFYNIWLKDHNALRIEFIQKDIVRIRYKANGVFNKSLTEKYDLITTEFDSYNKELNIEKLEDYVYLTNEDLKICVCLENGNICMDKKSGERIIESLVPMKPQIDKGVGATFKLKKDERFYGGGYRATDRIEYRGMILKNWCNDVVNYGPSPFIMSSNNWGVFWNITYKNFFDIGNKDKEKMVLWSQKGELDLFIFFGKFKHMIDSYTKITGKPMLMPLFGYGLTNVCSECMNQYTLLDIAQRFRKEKIPCDTLSLEPDWMEKRYDTSVNQEWNKEKYHIDSWMSREKRFIDILGKKGFKLLLWTPVNYDLTYEAEREYKKKYRDEIEKPLYCKYTKAKKGKDVFVDEHFNNDIRSDEITVPKEAWFDHFIKFFDIGVRGLKQDGYSVILPHPDKFYANKKSDDEMHNLNQSLILKQYNQGYRKYSGKRSMIYSPSTYIGNQKWGATWAGDVGGGVNNKISLHGLLNYSMQGHMNFACDIDNSSLEGIHFGFFMGWAQFCNWAKMCEPWYMESYLFEAFKSYANLRYMLLPYIYSSAFEGYLSGFAICRAMVLMYPEDEKTWNMDKEYMFGDWLLVGVFSKSVYLPEGKWIDYWTNEEYLGNQTIDSGYPKNRGGYLFIKKGAIIPVWDKINYVGEKTIDKLILKIYPYQKSSFTFYEDDGETYEYEKGKYAYTEITSIEKTNKIIIDISKRKGAYKGMNEKLVFSVEVKSLEPKNVKIDKNTTKWDYDRKKGLIILNVDTNGHIIEIMY